MNIKPTRRAKAGRKGRTMLYITSFTVGDQALIYHGAKLVVDVMDDDCERQIDERRFVCAEVSDAMKIIEAMEAGEEV